MTPAELDRKHSELLEKLNQANAAALGKMRTLTKDVKTEGTDLRKSIQGQIDPQRADNGFQLNVPVKTYNPPCSALSR
jgi:hypothetical protein